MGPRKLLLTSLGTQRSRKGSACTPSAGRAERDRRSKALSSLSMTMWACLHQQIYQAMKPCICAVNLTQVKLCWLQPTAKTAATSPDIWCQTLTSSCTWKLTSMSRAAQGLTSQMGWPSKAVLRNANPLTPFQRL